MSTTIAKENTKTADEILAELKQFIDTEDLQKFLIEASHNKMLASEYLDQPVIEADEHIAIVNQLQVLFVHLENIEL